MSGFIPPQKVSSKDIDNLSLGRVGKIIVKDTNTHTGNFAVLLALETSAVDEMTDATIREGSPSGIVLEKNMLYFGHITSFKLRYGSVIAFDMTE